MGRESSGTNQKQLAHVNSEPSDNPGKCFIGARSGLMISLSVYALPASGSWAELLHAYDPNRKGRRPFCD